MECFSNPWDLFDMSVWERAHRKHLTRDGSWKMIVQTVYLLPLKRVGKKINKKLTKLQHQTLQSALFTSLD